MTNSIKKYILLGFSFEKHDKMQLFIFILKAKHTCIYSLHLGLMAENLNKLNK